MAYYDINGTVTCVFMHYCSRNDLLDSTGSIFSVSSTTGEVTLQGVLDRETTRTHVITIQVSWSRLLIL